ncbi:hypothetical protein P0D88_11145 [Paraburkholderia sp. RL18-103-BIB-C]|uniref:hypothetical protein n=1 Tax=unclassified Paraburkholderia TaxID=2615204 RepID=UPI002F8F00CA
MDGTKGAIFTPPTAQGKRAGGTGSRNKPDSGVFASIGTRIRVFVLDPCELYFQNAFHRMPSASFPRVKPVHRLLAAGLAVPAIAARVIVGDAVRASVVRMKV